MTEPDCALIIEGQGETRRVSLGAASIVVGRDEAADVPIDDPKLSRRHAAFRLIDGHPYVEDLGSINGVKLRGRRIESRRRLRDGDRLRLGHTLIRVQAASLPPPTASLGPRLLGPELELSLGQTVFAGRTADCQVRSDEPSVSRRHARIDPEPLIVHDLDSANGVFVNDVRVRWSELRDGDELRFGQLGFEVEIPMDASRPRAQARWRPAWPRRLAVGAGVLLALTGAIMMVGGEKSRPGSGQSSAPIQPPSDSSSPGIPNEAREATAEAEAAQADEPTPPPAGAVVELEADAGSEAQATLEEPRSEAEGVRLSKVEPRPPTSSPSGPDERFDAPRAWWPALRLYFAGARASARRRARAPELVRWLQEADARHARALTEVSNDVARAKALLGALARTEKQVSPRVSPMRRDLEILLGAAFADRGARALAQSRGAEAFEMLQEAEALAPAHPRVRVLSQRLEQAARARADQAEGWVRRGDRRACGAWQDVEKMVAPDSSLGREARAASARTCP